MIDRTNGLEIGSGAWLREQFPEKDWHQHWRGRSGDTQWCDGTPSDCIEKVRF